MNKVHISFLHFRKPRPSLDSKRPRLAPQKLEFLSTKTIFWSDSFNEPTTNDTVKTLKCQCFYNDGSPLSISLLFSMRKQNFTFKILMCMILLTQKTIYKYLLNNCFHSFTTVFKYSPNSSLHFPYRKSKYIWVLSKHIPTKSKLSKQRQLVSCFTT